MDSELSNEMIVCLMILKLSRDPPGHGPVSYNELSDALDGLVCPMEMSADLDYLYDLGMIDAGWTWKDGRWKRAFSISEDAEGFVESAYLRSTLSERM